MGRLTAKLREAPGGLWHWCPGCDAHHCLPSGGGWTYKGNKESPTFSPSFRHRRADGSVCHYELKGGVLQFCTDSTHKLAGQNIGLPDFPEAEAERLGL